MMRSLFSGVSGLRNHQVQMDIIGNNIANVNTIAFKSSRLLFQDMLSQTLRVAGGATEGRGGTNPQQAGLGMRIGSIDTIFSQGNLMATQRKTDLAIQGEGFFILSDGTNRYYSRAGGFDFDLNGRIVNPANGYFVQGYMATGDTMGTIIENVKIEFNQSLPAKVTTEVSFAGNLDSDVSSTSASSSTLLMKLFDENGNEMNLRKGDKVVVGGTVGGATISAHGSYVDYTITENSSLSDLASYLEDMIRQEGDGDETVTVESNGKLQITAGSSENILGLSLTVSGNSELNSYGVIGDITSGNSGSTAEGSNAADYTTFVTAYDSLGNPQIISLLFAKATGASNTWNWQALVPYASGEYPSQDTGTLTFNADGSLGSGATTQVTFDPDGSGGAAEMTVNFDFGTVGDFDGITQFATSFSLSLKEQDGYASGTLDDIFIGDTGVVTGVFTNGVNRSLAQIALADFANPGGLLKAGDSLYKPSLSSGIAQEGRPGTGTIGTIASSTLEMSNVDLAQSFTEMILAQRGFQVNARVITTSDEMLQELVNLRR